MIIRKGKKLSCAALFSDSTSRGLLFKKKNLHTHAEIIVIKRSMFLLPQVTLILGQQIK